jgi:hydroxyacylglutathione hydrolase
MPAELTIKTFALGPWMTNCYVIHALPARPSGRSGPARTSAGEGSSAVGGGRGCWIVDAGFNPGPMLRYIEEHHLEPKQVILTHAHLDHIAGLSEIAASFPGVEILVHSAEKDFLEDPELNLSAAMDEDQQVVAPAPTGVLEHGQKLTIADVVFEVRHTPGHSPGGISLIQMQAGVAFVGDVLFAGSVGRSDFPTSDPDVLVRSIQTQLFTLPDTTRVLPGHGPPTTIGQEKRSNPYVRPVAPA